MNTDTATKPSVEQRSHSRDGLTRESMHRFMMSLTLWTFGIFAVLVSILSAAAQVIVPLFSLENEQWNRSDNPFTLVGACLCFIMGVLVISTARSTGRKRFWFGLAAAMAMAANGLHDRWLSGLPLFGIW